MIPVGLAQLTVICLGLMTVPVFVLWLVAEHRRSRSEAAVRARFVSCRLCGTVVDVGRCEGPLCTCPKCGALNGRDEG
jgi:hypothetical protein